MSDGLSSTEDVAAGALRVVAGWSVGVICVALAGGWVGARYAAALGAEVGGAANLAAGVLLVTIHLPAGAFAHRAGGRGGVSVSRVFLVALLINGVGTLVLAGLSPAPRCVEAWPAVAAGWCLVWSLTTAAWAWGWHERSRGWVSGGGFVLFVVGCVASAWLYARGPFALLPVDIGGGRPVEQSVIINGQGFVGAVVHLKDGWRVVIASDCAVLGGRVPTPPVVLHRPAGPVATTDTPVSADSESAAGMVRQ